MGGGRAEGGVGGAKALGLLGFLSSVCQKLGQNFPSSF